MTVVGRVALRVRGVGHLGARCIVTSRDFTNQIHALKPSHMTINGHGVPALISLRNTSYSPAVPIKAHMQLDGQIILAVHVQSLLLTTSN